MNSFSILRKLVLFWEAIDNPIFWRQTFRPPVWHRASEIASRSTGLALTLGGLTCYLHTLLVFYVNNLLIMLLPPMLVWTVLLGMAIAPLVVRERELGTWETLQTVPLSLEAILLGKAGGALWWLRDIIRIMSGVLILVSIAVGLNSLAVITEPLRTNAHYSRSLLCGLTLILPFVSAMLFLIDRAQQFVLTILSALAVSSSATSSRLALPGASAATLMVWLIDIFSGTVVLLVQPAPIAGHVREEMLVLATLGPTASYLRVLPWEQMFWYVGATILVREIAIQVVWRWTLRAARELA